MPPDTYLSVWLCSVSQSDECVERLQTCQFCELELPWKELDKHCLACGSRTELCRDCGHYVKLSDKPQHGLTCSATNSNLNPPQTAQGSPSKSEGTQDSAQMSNLQNTLMCLINSCHANSLSTAKLTVRCSTCMAPFPADDIDQHKV